MRAVIVGGAGFLGSHLVDALQSRGDEVTVFDPCLAPTHPDGRSQWLSPAADLRMVDPRADQAAFVSAVEGADALVHLGALTGTGQSMYEIARYADVNAGLCAWLAELLLHRAITPGRMVYTSTRAVYGEGVGVCEEHGRTGLAPRDAQALRSGRWDAVCARCGSAALPVAVREDDAPAPTSPYAMTKLWGEQVLSYAADTTGTPLTLLRLFNVYGPRQSPSNPYVGVVGAFARAVLGGQELELYEDGRIVRDFVFVGDVIGALLAALASAAPPRGPLHVGSGEATTLEDLSVALARLVGRAPRHRVSGRARLGDPRAVTADLTRVERELGWMPATSLLDGLAATLEWLAGAAVADSGVTLERSLEELSSRGLLVESAA